MDIYRSIVLLHLITGSVALLGYWSAALARKGGLLHRRIGRIYLVAMCGVLVTSVPIAIAFLLRGRPGIATFLGYLVVITASACWLGWRAIRSKRDIEAFHGRSYRVLGWANLLSGVLVFGVGVHLGVVLLIAFSWIGILGGAAMLRQARRLPQHPRWWLREHYTAMLANGVATHIAFLNIGLTRLLAPLGIQPPQLLAWLLPVAVAFAAGLWLDRKYGGASTRPARAPVGPVAERFS